MRWYLAAIAFVCGVLIAAAVDTLDDCEPIQLRLPVDPPAAQ